MPTSAPQSLSNDEVYAVTAYILNLNNIVDVDSVMNATNLPNVKMPNRDGFIDLSGKK
jgi:cytochrome c